MTTAELKRCAHCHNSFASTDVWSIRAQVTINPWPQAGESYIAERQRCINPVDPDPWYPFRDGICPVCWWRICRRIDQCSWNSFLGFNVRSRIYGFVLYRILCRWRWSINLLPPALRLEVQRQGR